MRITLKLPFLLAIIQLTVSCSSVFGQAVYWFQNISLDAPVFDANGVRLSGTNYSVQLYGGDTPDSLYPALTRLQGPLIVPFMSGAAAGFFQSNENAYLWNAEVLNWLQVRAWDNRLGATYAEVAARGLGGYGESPLFYAPGGTSGQFETPTELLGLKSFSLRPTTPAVLMRSIHRDGNQITLGWNPGFARYQLQQTASLDQPWQNLGDPTTLTTATIPISGPTQFFRVIGFLQ